MDDEQTDGYIGQVQRVEKELGTKIDNISTKFAKTSDLTGVEERVLEQIEDLTAIVASL